MRYALLRTVALSVVLIATPASARTRIIVLPPDAAGIGAALLKHIADSVMSLGSDDRLLVYAAQPVTQIALIARPTDLTLNSARIKATLAAQFKPVRDYLAAAKGAESQPVGNLMIPAVIDEIGRNLLPGLPERNADIVFIGSLIYADPRDGRTAMTDRYVPSDGTLRASRAEWIFSTVGAEERLSGVTVHVCAPKAATEFDSDAHEERVKRFWSLYVTAQGGRVGTYSHDLATCFRRFDAGETSGQTVYQPSRDAKPEMLRVPARVPAALPASFENPGQYFLRDDVPLSRTPPAKSKGIAWVGIKWRAACDIDLYARGDPSSPWLYFGNARSAEGYFNKDIRSGGDEAQLEFVEFTDAIELGKAEAAINLYACDAAAPPEGTVRIWFAGKVYEAPFKLTVKSGNRGAMPIGSPYWLRVDVGKAVGLKRNE
jgi:hypothetical protein